MSGDPGPEIAVLGNLIVDDIVYADGRTRMGLAGGAVTHFALGARLWNRSVGIVSVAGSDYPGDVMDGLAESGVDLDGVRRVDGPGMRSWLLYEGSRRRVVHRLSSPRHEDGSPDIGDIPAHWSPSVIHLAPMPLDRQRAWLRHLRPRTSAILSVDPFALISEQTWDDCIDAFQGADVLLASEDEVLLCPDVDHRDRWFGSGIPWVLVKQGAGGGTVYDTAGREVQRWAARVATVVDPTGAGDAFAGGLAAGLAAGVAAGRADDAGKGGASRPSVREPLNDALNKAVVSASFALESLDLRAMIDIEPSAAEARRAEWFG
ncbi:MAG: carbohydrate kinase family protein [Acidimicrobiia bacterium]|nr:carbohydrate kinase family protein [Acidimicrobiia bacterium]